MKKRSYPNINWRDGVAQLEVIVRGKRHRESLHTSNFNEAVERRDKRIAELREGVTDESATWHTPGTAMATLGWQQLRDWDMARMRGDGSRPEVVESSLGCTWKRLAPYFPDAHAVSHDSLEQFRHRQLAAGVSSATIKRDLYAIQRAYDWACDQLGTLPVLRRRRVKMRPTPRRKAKGVFIDAELLAAIARRLRGPALYKLAVCVTTGIRSGEWARIEKDWLRRKRIDGAWAYFLDLPEGATKTGDERSVPLSATTFAMLQQFPDFKVNYRRAWTTAAKAEGLARLSQRDLRHTFATTLAAQDKWATDIAMGHKDPADTVGSFYQTVTDKRMAALAQLALKAWPWVVAGMVPSPHATPHSA